MILKKKFEIFSLHIKCSIKNTIINLVDNQGKTLKQWSTKSLKKIDLKKNNPYNIFLIINKINKYLIIKKIKYLNLFFKENGIARYYILKNLKKNLKIYNIFYNTNLPFNGCRQKKKKRY